MKRKNLFRMVYTALFAALIFIGTFVFKIPTPIGYIHLGDGFIFIAAAILPTPYALAASMLGAGLSDLIGGFPLWVAPTIIIKCACALCFTSKKQKFLCLHNFTALAASLVITVLGYYLFGALIYGDFITPAAEIAFNALQSFAGALLFFAFGVAFDRAKGLREAVFGRIL